MTERQKNRVVQLYQQRMSIDAIITVTGLNRDAIAKTIQQFRWDHFRKTGVKL